MKTVSIVCKPDRRRRDSSAQSNEIWRHQKVRECGTLISKTAFMILLIAAFGVCASPDSRGATRTSAATGNWSSTSTWVGGVVPTTSDDVVIGSSHVVTVDVDATVISVTVTPGSAVTARLVVNADLTLTGSGECLVVNGSTSTAYGQVLINSASASITLTNGSARLNATSTGSQSAGNSQLTVGDGTLTITNGNVTITTQSSTSPRIARLSIAAGTAVVGGNVTFSGTGSSTNAQVRFTAAGTLKVGGNLGANGSVTQFTTTAPYSTIEFNGAGAKTNGAYNSFGNLIVRKTGGGSVTLSGTPMTVAGNLSIESGTLDVGTTAHVMTVKGNWTNNGGTFNPRSGTVTFDSPSHTIGGSGSTTFYTLNLLQQSSATGITSITLNGDVTANSLLVDKQMPGAATFNLEIGDGKTLTVTNTMTLGNGYASGNTTHALSGNGSLVCGAVSVGDNAPNSSTTLLVTVTSTIATFTIAGNLTLNGDYASSNRFNNPVFNLQSGTMTVGGSVTTANDNASNSSTFSMATGTQTATLNLGGTPPFNLSGTGTNTITLNGTGATVNYTGADGTAQTVYTTTYQNLGLTNGTSTGSAAKNTIGNILVSGNLTVNGGVVFSPAAANTVGGTGTLTGTGIVQVTRTAATADFLSQYTIANKMLTNLTVDYASAGDNTVNALSYNNLTLSGSGIKTLPGSAMTISGNFTLAGTVAVSAVAPLTIGGNFTIGSGTTFTAGSFTHTLGGNWINSGTFNAGTSTFVLSGAGGQSMSGSTFNNLEIASAAGVTMLTDETVNGTLTLTSGAFNVGAHTLALNGPAIAGTPDNLVTTSSSNLILGGSSAGVSIPGSVSQLNNLVINNSNGAALAGGTTVNGTLTLTQGALAVGTQALTVMGAIAVTGGSLTSSATGTVNYFQPSAGQTVIAANYGNLGFSDDNKVFPASGSVRISGTFSPGSATGHTLTGSTIEFNGAAAQALPAVFQPYNNLTINNGSQVSLGGAATIQGTLTLTNGTLDVGANTLELNGPAIAGTSANLATSNASSLIFGGTASGVFVPTSVSQLLNLTIGNTGASVALGSSVAIDGTLQIDAGAELAPSPAVVVSGSGTLTGSGTAQVTRVASTADFGSQYPITTADLTNLTVRYIGTAAQVITPLTYNNLTIENPSGLTLGGPVSVTGTLTLVDGKVTLGSSTLLIGPYASILGATASRYIVTNGPGFLKRTVGGAAVVFPLGTSSSYVPATLQNSGMIDNFSARVQSGFDNAPVEPDNVVNMQWTMHEETAGGSDCAITFQWNAGDEGSSLVRTNPLVVGRWDGASWVSTGVSSSNTSGAGPYTVSASGFTTFSEFGIGAQSALPVELTAFSATQKADAVELRWRTVTEANNYGFDIQKSFDATSWKTVGFAEGNGTVNSPRNYAFTDRLSETDLRQRVISYRLKQIDRNGAFAYSPVVTVSMTSNPGTLLLQQNYPNPFNPATSIPFTIPAESVVRLSIFDMLGREIATLVDETKGPGSYIVNWSARSADHTPIPSGLYFCRIHVHNAADGTDIRETRQMILAR
jgi:hypothetical protein